MTRHRFANQLPARQQEQCQERQQRQQLQDRTQCDQFMCHDGQPRTSSPRIRYEDLSDEALYKVFCIVMKHCGHDRTSNYCRGWFLKLS